MKLFPGVLITDICMTSFLDDVECGKVLGPWSAGRVEVKAPWLGAEKVPQRPHLQSAILLLLLVTLDDA